VISVLIVDDQDLVREGLRMLLEAEPDLRVGIEATTRLVQGGCRARILMLTTFNLDEYAYHALRPGRAASCSRTPAASSRPAPCEPLRLGKHRWRPPSPGG
jgi:DNA-binding NarL/FixJ family response regulator